MRLEAVVICEDVSDTVSKVGVEPPRQPRQKTAKQVAHCVNGIVGIGQDRRAALSCINEHKLPQLACGLKSVPGGVRPEEVVQVANRINVQVWVLACERFYLVLRVQANDVCHGAPLCKTRGC